MKNSTINKKISILGTGIFGKISAICCAKAGFEVFLIDIEKKTSKDISANSLVLTAYTKKFVTKLNFWENIINHICNIKDIYVLDNMSNNMISFNTELDKDKSLKEIGFVIKNEILIEKLNKAIAKESNIIKIVSDNYRTEHLTETPGTKIILDDNQEVDSCLTLVTTGPKSQIHRKYFEDLISKQYHQVAITCIVKHKKPHDETAVEHFIKSSIFAILPLSDKNTSSVVWSVDRNYGKLLVNLERDIFNQILQENFGDFLGKVTVISNINTQNLVGYLSKNYVNKRFIALGASAHIIHPLAGQGLNLSIKDLALLDELCLNNGTFKQQNLIEFQKQRLQDNLNMFTLTDSLNKIFAPKSKLLYCARQIGFNIIEKLPRLKTQIMRYAMGFR